MTARFDTGRKMLEAEQYDEAVAEFDFVVRFRPDFAEGYLGRGVALLALEKDKEASADFTKAIELDPKGAVAYRNRAVVKFRAGNTGGGTDDLVQALNLYTEAGDQKGIDDVRAVEKRFFMH